MTWSAEHPDDYEGRVDREVGFLREQDTELADPAYLIRAIQQLSSRVLALEGGSATAA
jgi:hypothetical protein